MKLCSECKIQKSLDEFNKSSRNIDKLQAYCRICSNMLGRKWAMNNAERKALSEIKYYELNKEKKKLAAKLRYKADHRSRRNRHLLKFFGINLIEYESLWVSQGQCCKICKRTENNGREFPVDHCHTTNQIRGILCSNCNTLLGLSNESKEILETAIKYLLSETTGIDICSKIPDKRRRVHGRAALLGWDPDEISIEIANQRWKGI